MDDFFEVDEKKKTVKSINLDDFSIEDLEKYKTELNKEILRVNLEIEKKGKLKSTAEEYFN
tara:strand:+ start:710 stop:892 length:183 start_codon:yes stop_codon:yes gene_type:complete